MSDHIDRLIAFAWNLEMINKALETEQSHEMTAQQSLILAREFQKKFSYEALLDTYGNLRLLAAKTLEVK